MVDAAVMRGLQIPPSGAADFHSASSSGLTQHCEVHDVVLILGGAGRPTALRFDPIGIMATELINQPFYGLLGRDVLNHLRLSWNGPSGELVIAYN